MRMPGSRFLLRTRVDVNRVSAFRGAPEIAPACVSWFGFPHCTVHADERSTMSPAAKKTGFSAEEKAAMRARAKELKEAQDGESAVKAALAKMSPKDRALGKRFHAIVTESAPHLTPKTWYGIPAYAKDGKVVCFFRDAGKFKERYAMFGFNDIAKLDEGSMWPVAFALTKLSAADEARIGALVKKAVG